MFLRPFLKIFPRNGIFYTLDLYNSGTPELLKSLLDGFQ